LHSRAAACPWPSEVAQALNAPLDILLVGNLGVPGHEELAMGAIASGGVYVVNAGVVRSLGISASKIEEVTVRERVELERRERIYRADGRGPDVRGQTVILVDDGLATGTTMRAAITLLRKRTWRASSWRYLSLRHRPVRRWKPRRTKWCAS
jgi:putative phosphoribosyl transferase